MAREPTTWIKLNRNILEWRWFKDANTLQVFMYLLLSANTKDAEFKDIVIRRGELVRTQAKIAEDTGLSRQQIRTVLCKLEATNEITKETRSTTVVISIVGYDKYQNGNQHFNQPITNEQPRIKNNKNIKNTLSLSSLSLKPYAIPTLDEVREYERASGIGKDADLFYEHYSSEGWKAQGKKIYNWQRLYDSWKEPEKKKKQVISHPRYTDEDGYTFEWDYDTNRYEVVARPKRKGKVKHEDDES